MEWNTIAIDTEHDQKCGTVVDEYPRSVKQPRTYSRTALHNSRHFKRGHSPHRVNGDCEDVTEDASSTSGSTSPRAFEN